MWFSYMNIFTVNKNVDQSRLNRGLMFYYSFHVNCCFIHSYTLKIFCVTAQESSKSKKFGLIKEHLHYPWTRGWIHPCVMDCFGMLTTTDQNHHRREGLFGKNDTVCMIWLNHLIKIWNLILLMLLPLCILSQTILVDPNLNCSDPGL
jgi:hypothetical protein